MDWYLRRLNSLHLGNIYCFYSVSCLFIRYCWRPKYLDETRWRQMRL